ncbi:hypothetical protein [Pedobacter antarcticus]|uniref:hypothetical protein n=1 Tax=Pedobacter antarcticus TaxID=34086 RepID=UPI001C57F055|nr:hypothetical protein [Pedobacter antarcticus]
MYVDAPHGPLLLIGGEEDQIIPSSLTEKNYKAYTDKNSITALRVFPEKKSLYLQRAWLGRCCGIHP